MSGMKFLGLSSSGVFGGGGMVEDLDERLSRSAVELDSVQMDRDDRNMQLVLPR
jgi:hypothetical protein